MTYLDTEAAVKKASQRNIHGELGSGAVQGIKQIGNLLFAISGKEKLQKYHSQKCARQCSIQDKIRYERFLHKREITGATVVVAISRAEKLQMSECIPDETPDDTYFKTRILE